MPGLPLGYHEPPKSSSVNNAAFVIYFVVQYGGRVGVWVVENEKGIGSLATDRSGYCRRCGMIVQATSARGGGNSREAVRVCFRSDLFARARIQQGHLDER